MINKKIVCIVLVLMMMLLITIFLRGINNKIFSSDSIVVKNNNIDKLSIYDNAQFLVIMETLSKKNANWSKLPLSRNFTAKFNSTDGIFKEYDYDYVGLIGMTPKIGDDTKGYFSFNLISYYNTNYQAIKIKTQIDIGIVYYINNKDEIDDIEIEYIDKVIDESGAGILTWADNVNASNFKEIIEIVLFYDHNVRFFEQKKIELEKYPCSARFKNKITNNNVNDDRIFVDLFYGLDYDTGISVNKKDDVLSIKDEFKNRYLYVLCEKYLTDKEPIYDDFDIGYVYKINFVLDDNGMLDDISVKFIEKINYEEFLKSYEF